MRSFISPHALFLLALVSLLPGLHALGQSAATKSAQSPKKEQTIKVLIKKDGKLIESDTTFVTSDGKSAVVNEKGVTYNTSTIVSKENGNGKGQKVMVVVNEENGEKGNVHTYTYTTGDTLQNDLERKVIRLNDGKRFIIMQDGNKAVFSQPVPPPGAADVMMVRSPHDPYAFDPSDPDIVSYKKKDKRNGLEQIVIVRKKK